MTLVLEMPNFGKIFVVICDAFVIGLGAVHMYEGRLIAFVSKTLSLQNQALFTPKNKMLVIVFTVLKCWDSTLRSRQTTIASNICWNNISLLLCNISGYLDSLDLILKSHIVLVKKKR